MDKMLDLENGSISDKIRRKFIEEVVLGKAIPFLKDLSKMDNVERFLHSSESKKFLVSLKVKRKIGLEEN